MHGAVYWLRWQRLCENCLTIWCVEESKVRLWLIWYTSLKSKLVKWQEGFQKGLGDCCALAFLVRQSKTHLVSKNFIIVAQLLERWSSMSKVPGSNPTIVITYLIFGKYFFKSDLTISNDIWMYLKVRLSKYGFKIISPKTRFGWPSLVLYFRRIHFTSLNLREMCGMCNWATWNIIFRQAYPKQKHVKVLQ